MDAVPSAPPLKEKKPTVRFTILSDESVSSDSDDFAGAMWRGGVETRSLEELQADDRRSKRTFHDVPCFVLFYLVMGLFSYTMALAYTYGEPSALPIPDPAASYAEHKISDFAGYEIALLKHDTVYIFMGLLIGVFLSIGWLELIKRTSFYLVYGLSLLTVTLIVLLGVYLYQAGHRVESTELLIIAGMCWLGALLLCIVGYVMKDKLDFTVEVMAEASKLLAKVPQIYVVGIVMIVVYFVVFTLWLTSLIYLFSVPNVKYLVWDSGDSAALLNYVFSGGYRHYFWILLFGGLWLLSVLGFQEQYVIASVVHQRLQLDSGLRKHDSNIIYRAALEATTTSFGSLAFGSLLTASAWLLGLFAKLEFLKSKIPWRDYWISKLAIDIFTFILEYVSDFAVIFVAVEGKSFLQSSKTVVGLLRGDVPQAAVSGMIVSLILLIGKLACTVLISLFVVWLIDFKHLHVGSVSVLVVIGSTYYLFHLLSKVYLVTVNTLLIYTLHDLSLHREDKEFKSPERLRNILLLNKAVV